MIKVIETSTAERKQEIIDLFTQIKPYLDEGYSFGKALMKVGRITSNGGGMLNPSRGWFGELIDYAKTEGYEYRR